MDFSALLFDNDSCSLNLFFAHLFMLSWNGDCIKNLFRMLILVYCHRRSLTFEQIVELRLVLGVENWRVGELRRLWQVLPWVNRWVNNPALIRKMAIWDSWRRVLLHYEHILLFGARFVWYPRVRLTESRVMESSLSAPIACGLLLIGRLSFLSGHIDHVLLLVWVSTFLPTLDYNFLVLLNLSGLTCLSHLYKSTIEHSWARILDRTFHARIVVREAGTTWGKVTNQTWVSIALPVRVAFDSIVTLFWCFKLGALRRSFARRATISTKIFIRCFLQMVDFFACCIFFWLAWAALDYACLLVLRLSLGRDLREDQLRVGMVMIVSGF